MRYQTNPSKFSKVMRWLKNLRKMFWNFIQAWGNIASFAKRCKAMT